MISFKEWRMLNEHLGVHTLGLTHPTNIGVVGNKTEPGETVAEMGMPFMGKKPFGKGKMMPPPHPDMDMGDEEGMGDEEMGDDEMGHDHDELGDDEMGDEEMGDEDHDHDEMGDDLGDEEGMGDEEMGEEMPMKKPMFKKKPMGMPHDAGAFMQYSKRMQKEAKGCECGDGDMDKGDETDDKLINPKDNKPAFLSKKSKKSKKMKETNQQYEIQPKNYDVTTDDQFMQSVAGMFGKPGTEKFFDGVSEDVLIAPTEPEAGEPGFAPQTRIGEMPNQIAENLDDLKERLNKLEQQLKGKCK